MNPMLIPDNERRFPFPESQYRAIRKIGKKQRLQAYEAMFAYYFDGKVAEDGVAAALVIVNKQEMDRARAREERRLERLGSRAPARRALSARTRFEVLKRDGFACRYCGRKAPSVELHVDHVVPVALGGTDDLGNLVTACAECNLGKSCIPIE